MTLVDSHAHLDAVCFEEDLEPVLRRSREAGVFQILTVGCLNAEQNEERSFHLLDSWDGIVGAFGIHPHDAACYSDAVELRLISALEHAKAVALGEIGLDYYYDNSPRDLQKEAFRRQIELARERKMPIIVHSRDAEEDTLEILRSEYSEVQERPGVIHCFTGSSEMAQACIDLGFFIGFGGILTFRKADELRSIAASIPLERLLIETDCPYLAPEPMRGKRNEPAYVKPVAEKLSELRGVSFEEIAVTTTRNFRRLFSL